MRSVATALLIACGSSSTTTPPSPGSAATRAAETPDDPVPPSKPFVADPVVLGGDELAFVLDLAKQLHMRGSDNQDAKLERLSTELRELIDAAQRGEVSKEQFLGATNAAMTALQEAPPSATRIEPKKIRVKDLVQPTKIEKQKPGTPRDSDGEEGGIPGNSGTPPPPPPPPRP